MNNSNIKNELELYSLIKETECMLDDISEGLTGDTRADEYYRNEVRENNDWEKLESNKIIFFNLLKNKAKQMFEVGLLLDELEKLKFKISYAKQVTAKYINFEANVSIDVFVFDKYIELQYNKISINEKKSPFLTCRFDYLNKGWYMNFLNKLMHVRSIVGYVFEEKTNLEIYHNIELIDDELKDTYLVWFGNSDKLIRENNIKKICLLSNLGEHSSKLLEFGLLLDELNNLGFDIKFYNNPLAVLNKKNLDIKVFLHQTCVEVHYTSEMLMNKFNFLYMLFDENKEDWHIRTINSIKELIKLFD